MKKNSPEHRRAMKEAIEKYKRDNPQSFAVLLMRAKDSAYDARLRTADVVRRSEEARKIAEEIERAKFEQFTKPIVVGLPDIDMSGVRGLVAYKTWDFDGRLRSTAMSYRWKELNFADRIPNRENQNGFYCIKMSSLGVMSTGSSYFSNYGRTSVSGFVELLGKVVEHTDGVLRAEVAKLICLFVTSDNQNVAHAVQCLHKCYITPVYVLNPEQLADVIFREVLRQKYMGWNDD